MSELRTEAATPPTGATGPTAPRAVHVREAGRTERDPVRQARRQRFLDLVPGLAFPVVLVGLWQLAATQGWIDRFNYPAPSDIVSEIGRTFRENPKGNWWHDVWISVQRMLWGYGWGLLSGLLLGVTMGMSRVLRATLEPTLNALYTVPKLALIGIFLIVFGFDDTPIIAVVAVTVFFFVWIQAMAAVMAVSFNFREAARSFGVSRFQMFRHVILPASTPQVFVGLRVAAGVAVLTLIGAEFVFAPGNAGIGYRINNARQILDPVQAYVGLVVAALLGVVFTGAIKALGRALTRWAPKDNAVG